MFLLPFWSKICHTLSMDAKSVAVDMAGTFGISSPALVDLKISRPWIPVNGFEWKKGPNTDPGPFLVRKAGEHRQGDIPPDLHLKFADLDGTQHQILRFATDHGILRVAGSEEGFHPDGAPDRWEPGERLETWQKEIKRFRAVRELWYSTQCSISEVRAQLRNLPKRDTGNPNDPWILVWEWAESNDPIERAMQIITHTINAGLTASESPGVKWAPLDSTRAFLRLAHKRYDLVVVPTTLIKALWLQTAAMVTGQRIVKKCQAPDCQGYFDVTKSEHPAARKMHPHCSERIRKRRYRENQNNVKTKTR